MALKIGVSDFRDVVNDILTEYGDQAREAVELACKDTARETAKELQSADGTVDKFQGGKEYRKGWTSKVELTRTGAQAIVYNKTKPGLSHLLEFGHALRNGGRSTAFNFIAPIDATVGDKLLDNIDKRLGG